MRPIATPAIMRAVDAAAPEPVEMLIDRAGRALARTALAMMGGTYGRRVVVVSGPGNNGADGRAMAHHLQRRGVRCVVFDAGNAPDELPRCDLIVDAAYGTGISRPYSFPPFDAAIPVLAADIPSGVSGLTGEAMGRPAPASVTLTFASLKPGLVLEPGRSLVGRVEVADIGLDVGDTGVNLVESGDVRDWIPERPADDHKWKAAVRIIAGSAGMTGAAHLASRSAMRCGAGYVQLATPGLDHDPAAPTEAVGLAIPAEGWGDRSLLGLERFQGMLIGPGLGRGAIADLLEATSAAIPLVVDGDALVPRVVDRLRCRKFPTVVTPHDGEWRRLGASDSSDRIAATREFAGSNNVVTLRKGATTVIAAPSGEVLVVANGTNSLATAGTGDVLSGMIVAMIASGLDPFSAAASAAFVHAEAARIGGRGLVAGDLPELIPVAIDSLGVRS